MAGPASAEPAAHRVWHMVAWTLLLIGALRLGAVAAHQPLAAYANQYDMARTSACLGLWPDGPAAARAAAHPVAPRDAYHYGLPGDDAACFASTEVAIAWVAVQLDRAVEAATGSSAGDFKLRQLAWLQLALLLAIALYLHARLRRWPRWQAGAAAAFALVIADPFNALFLASLYTELPALLGLWLAVGCLVVLCLAQRQNRRLARDLPWILALGLLLLGTSRVPHALLPMWLLACGALALWTGDATRRRHRLRILWPALVAVAVALILPIHNARVHPEITRANAVDGLFGAVLPASDDAPRLAARLGLPPACATLVFATWYRGHGHDPLDECPEALRVSRLRELVAFAREPATALRLFGRGVMLSADWRLPYLGEVAGGNLQHLAQPGITAVIAPRSFVFHVALWALALWLLPWSAWRTWRRGDACDVLALTLAGTVVMVWLISVLGDGYSELTRHLNLAENAILVLWLLTTARFIASLVTARRLRQPVWPQLVGVFLAIFITLGAATAWARLPMAIGIFDAPDGQTPVADTFEVHGWVVSTRGLAGLVARVGDGPRSGMTLTDDSALARFFAFNHGRTAQRFHGRVAWPANATSPADLHLIADEAGRQREIDRVRLVRAPEAAKLAGSAQPTGQ